MSVAKKIIALLVLIALLIGGLYLVNKYLMPNDDQTVEQATEDMTGGMSEPVHDHDHGDNEDTIQPSADSVSETGAVTVLPILPILGQRGVGDPNAPVKIEEFFSLTCNHCADFHKTTYQELKSKYIDTGKVYFVFQEFPLNGPALYGSMIARCLPDARYASFINLLLRNQDVWAYGGDFKAGLMQNAKLAGMSEEEFETCFNDKKLQEEMATNISAASTAYKISSTPSFVFNDGQRIMRGAKSIEAFDAVIEELMNNGAE